MKLFQKSSKLFSSKIKNKKIKTTNFEPINKTTNKTEETINNSAIVNPLNKDFNSFVDNDNHSYTTYDFVVENLKFQSTGKLLILKVDNQQKYLLLIVTLGLGSIAYFFYRRYYKCSIKIQKNIKETKSNPLYRHIFKYSYLVLTLIFLYCFLLFTYKINSFITKLYLLKDGKTLEIHSYFTKKIIDITEFKLVTPKDNTDLSQKQYSQQHTEGFPIQVNKSVLILSKSSIIYEKQILGEISKGRYLNII